MVANKPTTVSDPLENALLLKVKRLTSAKGQLVLPCVPALLDEYVEQFHRLLVALGQNFTPSEIQALRQLVQKKLTEGYNASPHARLVFKYEPPEPTHGLTQGLKLTVTTEILTIENKYQRWLTSREGPLFGSHPDAKLMAIASQLGSAAEAPILDVGAGVGRNTLPLARLGHPVDAVELTPEFAQIIANGVKAENLPVRVVQSNILNPALRLPQKYYKLAVVAEVISHFRALEEVRTLLKLMCEAIQPGGLLLFSTFVAAEGFEPDEKVREMSQVQWSYLLTRSELNWGMQGLPLQVLSDESVYEYERSHLSAEAWPPTPWFEHWALGRDVFPIPNPPMSLRWILCRVN
ncbi:class I SAM-dependent methyltransferase [Limnoraphis robusta]|uniref:Class I SAM-dependent methyltransferase n=1 Tax=Limnoraphis robusta CCNP1315 TaxID=3110306 RepID=A0ABU5U7G6_9CYAN|nr:class I SAM-dependent methyltransferase [Limnoraphis robusta]MEA5523119.1 class I SAM-dependent methyltransferase [Limnoraphis robusta CCNP1315]MEA5545361.1 class I SAM-dependent methyltransferase [Limnoraphis robusta CCNP1324]